MIFGAMIIGVALGLSALVAALLSGATFVFALGCYCVAGLLGATGSCAARAVRARVAPVATPANSAI